MLKVKGVVRCRGCGLMIVRVEDDDGVLVDVQPKAGRMVFPVQRVMPLGGKEALTIEWLQRNSRWETNLGYLEHGCACFAKPDGHNRVVAELPQLLLGVRDMVPPLLEPGQPPAPPKIIMEEN